MKSRFVKITVRFYGSPVLLAITQYHCSRCLRKLCLMVIMIDDLLCTLQLITDFKLLEKVVKAFADNSLEQQ